VLDIAARYMQVDISNLGFFSLDAHVINIEQLRDYSRKTILKSWDGEVPEAAVKSTH